VQNKKVFKDVNRRNLIKNTRKLTKKGKYKLQMQKRPKKLKRQKMRKNFK